VILACGLSPAWQQILVFDRFLQGEVNRASEAHWCGSGKVLNVAVALHHLAADVRTLSTLGGPAHNAIDREFAALGLSRRWIPTQAATRVCTTVLDAATGATTELVENASAIEPGELLSFSNAYAEEAAGASTVVITGSLPIGTPATFFRDLARRTESRLILDLRGPELLEMLELKPLVVKPNRQELASTIGRPLDNDVQMLQAMRDLNARGAQWVVVTSGAGVVWAAGPDGEFRFQPPIAEHVVNPIGCGDCFAAGLAWAVDAGKPMVEAIHIGIAAAAENLPTLLPARLDRARVLLLARRIERQA